MKQIKFSAIRNILLSACMVSCMLFNGSFSVHAAGKNEVTVNTPDMTGNQWYLMDDSTNNGVEFPGWNSYQNHVPVPNVDPGKEIVVAVLDSGVDYSHEDLAGVMWDQGLNYQALTALGGGRYGIDTVDGDNDPMDVRGHGTHVAGIIAAEWNEKGISGALCGVRIMAVRGTGRNTDSVKKGLEYILAAKQAGVNVAAVNLSWNGSTGYSSPEILDGIITRLGEAGVVTVFAAGNESSDLNETRVVSNYLRTNPYVITVSASGVDGKRWEDEDGGSNYSARWCDIVAPGQKILSTYLSEAQLTQLRTADPTMEDEPEQEDDPTAPDGYKYLSGTSMAAPIVAAALTLLYAEHPEWDAGQRAAALLEASDSSIWQSVYSGKVNPKAALSTANREPLVTYGESVGSKSVLTLYGYDFGGASGTVKVDGTKASVLSWSDRQIKVKGSFAPGEHSVQVTRADQKTSTRWVAVSGSSEEVIALNTDGLEGMYFANAAVLNGTLYALAIDSNLSSDCELYALENGTWTKKQLTGGPENFNTTTACAHQGKLYFFCNRTVYAYDPSSGTLSSINTGTSLDKSSYLILCSVDEHLYAVYQETDWERNEEWTKIDEIDPASGTCANAATIETEDVKPIGLVRFRDSLTVLTENYERSGITAYTVSDGTAKKLFAYSEPDEKDFGVDKKAYANNDHLIITPFAEQDGNGSWSFNAYELTASGTKLRAFRLGAGRVSITFPPAGGIHEKELYLIGTADAVPGNAFAFRIPLTEYVPPTPTPTPVPTPVPTSAPDSHTDSSSGVIPGSTVQTCQDVGYPSGWYWDESRKACAAPPKSSTGVPAASGSGTYSYRKNSSGTSTGTNTNTNTNTNTGTGGDDKPDSSADPETEPTESAEPEGTPTPTPEETIEPTPTAAPDLPMPIVNNRGIMWFLGIPLVMVLAGIVMYLLKDKQYVPYVIGIDAVIGLILAILDHSMVGWILLILNLAASGLMALYRLGKLDGE